MQKMSIGDVIPQDPSESQSPNDTTPPSQDHEQDQEDDQDEDQVHDQEESIDQGAGGAKDDGDHQGSRTKPPHPRVHQTIQRGDPVDNIPGDIMKGVTTRSSVASFCKHYSFVSSLEPFKVEEALCDPDWVVAM
jgi:hypothetical protein